MRGGISAEIIARQCSAAYRYNSENINRYAATRGVNPSLTLCNELSQVMAKDPVYPNNFFATL
jgi:hypothetical protein